MMSFFRDAGDSLIKYSEIIVNKTEEYTRIAKLTLDIKKLEGEIDKTCSELGNYVILSFEKGEKSVSLDDRQIEDYYKMVNEKKALIETKKNQINEIKRAGRTPKDQN